MLAQLIFIAEDNADMQQIYRVMLSDLADTLHIADNGIKAMDYLATHVPDLLILDINMPGLSGLDVLQRISQDERFATTKKIIVTSNAPAMNSEIASLADLIIIKPVNVADLKILAERLLSQA